MNNKLSQFLLLYHLTHLNNNDIYRARAYKSASIAVANVGFTITKTNFHKLSTLPKIGTGIMEKISAYFDRESKGLKVVENKNENKNENKDKNASVLTSIVGIGDKKALDLEQAGYKTVAQVRNGARTGKLILTHMQQMGVEYYADLLKKMTRSTTEQVAHIVSSHSTTVSPNALTIVGSYRRNAPLQNDVDLLFCVRSTETFLANLHSNLKRNAPEYINYLSAGAHKLSILIRCNSVVRQVDIFVCAPDEYATFLNYATGSFTHNENLRATAKRAGYKLNQYGLWPATFTSTTSSSSSGGSNDPKYKKITIKTEHDLYRLLGLAYVKPENR